VPKDSIGKDQDIVLKDWLRETFEAKHDRTRLWLTVGGAVIGALFSVLVIEKKEWCIVNKDFSNKESESKYSGPWECTFMGTIGAIGGSWSWILGSSHYSWFVIWSNCEFFNRSGSCWSHDWNSPDFQSDGESSKVNQRSSRGRSKSSTPQQQFETVLTLLF
jgi:hypothetical protein